MKPGAWAWSVTERHGGPSPWRTARRGLVWLLGALLVASPVQAVAAEAVSIEACLGEVLTHTEDFRAAEPLVTLDAPPSVHAQVVDLQPPRPDQSTAWQAVTLPFQTQRQTGDGEGDQDLRVSWYLLSYDTAGRGPLPLALYGPRISGGAVLVKLWRAGQWQLAWDGIDQWREQWNRPVWVSLGTPGPQVERVQLAVGVIHGASGSHRMSRLCVGPRESLQRRVEWRNWLQLVVPQITSLSFLALGGVALLFWLARRRDRAYLLFALSSLLWTLRNLHYYIDLPRDPQALTWFWWGTNISLSWVMVLIYLFACRFDHRRYPRVQAGMLGFLALATVASMPLTWSPFTSLVQLHLINAAVAVLVTSWLTWTAWHGGGREFRIITLALWVTQLLGLHDLLLLANVVSLESIYLLPWAVLVVFMAFLNAVQSRHATALDQAEGANARLEQRLAVREAELQLKHDRLSAVEQEQALLLERQRLMRDMHDGLGSTLMSTLVLVETGKLQAREVASLLRECVDDLRLVIDSMEPIDHDLVTLLASLRHRLGKRLEGAGLTMLWEVQDLPPLPWLHPPDALQVLRIAQEVLTNVLKHAQARTVRVGTRQLGDEVQVLIRDDGVGFDPKLAQQGRGLRHLGQRAHRLGGRIELVSSPGQGTLITLHLPLQRVSVA
jgi:signal transduction histidine kinase